MLQREFSQPSSRNQELSSRMAEEGFLSYIGLSHLLCLSASPKLHVLPLTAKVKICRALCQSEQTNNVLIVNTVSAPDEECPPPYTEQLTLYSSRISMGASIDAKENARQQESAAQRETQEHLLVQASSQAGGRVMMQLGDPPTAVAAAAGEKMQQTTERQQMLSRKLRHTPAQAIIGF